MFLKEQIISDKLENLLFVLFQLLILQNIFCLKEKLIIFVLFEELMFSVVGCVLVSTTLPVSGWRRRMRSLSVDPVRERFKREPQVLDPTREELRIWIRPPGRISSTHPTVRRLLQAASQGTYFSFSSLTSLTTQSYLQQVNEIFGKSTVMYNVHQTLIIKS